MKKRVRRNDKPSHDRYHGSPGDEGGMSLLGVVVALLIVAVVIWIFVGRFQGAPGGDDALDGGPPDMVSSLDHTRQQQTLVNMEFIARANDLRYAEAGSYAERLADLETRGQLLSRDGWGNPYVYSSSGGESYTLTSLGSDGAPGPAPPDPWPGSPYDPDLIMTTGRFTQGPGRR